VNIEAGGLENMQLLVLPVTANKSFFFQFFLVCIAVKPVCEEVFFVIKPLT